MSLPRRLARRFRDWLRSGAGQSLVEYSLILSLVLAVVIVIIIFLGNQTKNMYCNIIGSVGGA